MATWYEELSQTILAPFSGATSGDHVTGTSTDAYYEAAQQIANVSSAREWPDALLPQATALMDQAFEQANEKGGDADHYWGQLWSIWPDEGNYTGYGWNELEDVWRSYYDQSRGTYTEGADIVEETAQETWQDILSPVDATVDYLILEPLGIDPDTTQINYFDLAKATLVGGVVGLGASLVTGLNANVATGLGALGGLVWNFSNQVTD